MTANKRIFLNIVATYGRSLFSLACGLFTARWALVALGEVDYGLYGVVGGLTVFISFFVNLMSSAIGRFYAYSVGQAKIGQNCEGLENCRQWFNTAVALHVVLPLVFMAIGYPLGEYALRHAWLNVPVERVGTCLWVFRFVCISCFIGMMNVPFTAMYTAKQYIAELTVYSFVTTTLHVVLLYYMATHTSDWLLGYALCMCLLSVSPQLVIAIRACTIFPECRFNRAYLWNWGRVRSLCRFAGWQFFGNLGYMIRFQGIALLINKCFTPVHNTTMALANNVSAQVGTLTAAMNGAFYPVITTLAGQREREQMLNMMYRSCKLGMLACLLFAVPLMLEMNYVLTLWLKKLPIALAQVTTLTLAILIIDESTRGIGIAVTADGRIAKYYFLLGSLNIISLPLCWGWIFCGGGFVSVFMVLLLIRIIANVLAVVIARTTIAVSFRRWLKEVVSPVVLVSMITGAVGWMVRWLFKAGFLRLSIVSGLCGITFMMLTWLFVLSKDERQFVLIRFRSFFGQR